MAKSISSKRKICDNYYKATDGRFIKGKSLLNMEYLADEVAEDFFCI